MDDGRDVVMLSGAQRWKICNKLSLFQREISPGTGETFSKLVDIGQLLKYLGRSKRRVANKVASMSEDLASSFQYGAIFK